MYVCLYIHNIGAFVRRVGARRRGKWREIEQCEFRPNTDLTV